MLRPLGPPDQPAVAALWRAAWASANPGVAELAAPDHWHGRVQAEFVPPYQVWLAWQDEELAGFFVLEPVQCYLAQLFVAPALQGQGLGAQLLRAVDRLLPDGWTVHGAEGNLGARRFYERHGCEAGVVSVHPVTGRRRLAYHRPHASSALLP